jgi:hypothetical protein
VLAAYFPPCIAIFGRATNVTQSSNNTEAPCRTLCRGCAKLLPASLRNVPEIADPAATTCKISMLTFENSMPGSRRVWPKCPPPAAISGTLAPRAGSSGSGLVHCLGYIVPISMLFSCRAGQIMLSRFTSQWGSSRGCRQPQSTVSSHQKHSANVLSLGTNSSCALAYRTDCGKQIPRDTP